MGDLRHCQRIVRVKWIAMPNILAGEEVFPGIRRSTRDA
jgi:lipid A disaccharide synthetase